MSDTNDKKEKTEDDEKVPQMKTRHKQFFEERFSVITPKSQEEAPPSTANEFESTEPSVKENFRQDLMKQYRKSQKHKIEDE